MPEDRTPPFQPTRQYLLSEGQVRAAFVLSFVGMVALLLLLLFLATARPSGRLQRLGGEEFEAGLRSATANLEGYEVFEDGRARIDIDRAMELVAERGVVDPGFVAPGQAGGQPGAQAGAADPGAQPAGEVGADGDEQALPDVDGAVAYATCAACHQANGQGLPGAFPPLAGHAADLYATSRDYIVDVVLYGLTGQIQVDGVAYNGLMPSHAHMSDEEIAAILNHVLTSFGDEDVEAFEPYTAEDVAARRGQDLGFTDVYARRLELGLE